MQRRRRRCRRCRPWRRCPLLRSWGTPCGRKSRLAPLRLQAGDRARLQSCTRQWPQRKEPSRRWARGERARGTRPPTRRPRSTCASSRGAALSHAWASRPRARRR
eukprot:Amastigsp_a844130_30.p4 type:complete len:105 gc:universal Amastigsp_a844130_30:1381-1067(-)